jgi:hypothetical protein
MKYCQKTLNPSSQDAAQRLSRSSWVRLSQWGLALFVVCALAVSCGKKNDSALVSSPPDSKGTNATSAATARPEFAKLAG